jgi:two-component system, sensor histidine kinase and response regulator
VVDPFFASEGEVNDDSAQPQDAVKVRPAGTHGASYDGEMGVHSEKGHTRAGGPVRVLVVDDDESNRILAVRMLERLGHRATTAEDGIRALEALDAGGIELILMDCQMPRLDGFAATRELRLRESASGTHTTVIAVTASATERDRQACADAGMDDYITKPVLMSALASALERWLGGSTPPATQPGPADPAAESVPDLDRLRRDVGDHAAFSFVSTFLAGLAEREEAVADAVTTGSADRLARSAHALRSPSATVGGVKLADICARLEAEGKGGRVPPLEVLEELSAACDELRGSIGPLLDTSRRRWRDPMD